MVLVREVEASFFRLVVIRISDMETYFQTFAEDFAGIS
jgi:hypothetical protein